MGSTGSIVQTTKSDLDLWLCYSQELSREAYQTLSSKKLAKLTQWAKGLGIEVNFYLMNPERFKDNHHNYGVSERAQRLSTTIFSCLMSFIVQRFAWRANVYFGCIYLIIPIKKAIKSKKNRSERMDRFRRLFLTFYLRIFWSEFMAAL